MYNFLLLLTFAVLVIFFIVVEFYRLRKFETGVLVDFCPSEIGIDSYIASRLKVKLQNGEIVEAEALRCTLCLGNLSKGDTVKISKSNNKYFIHLPNSFLKNKTCSS